MKDEIVVVTGGTGAVGGAAAREFARRGATVVLLGRSAEKLARAADEVRASAPGAAVDVEVVDMGDRASVRRAGSALAARYPRIDALVHTAAQFRRERQVKDGLEEMFATNHLGVFLLTRLLEPSLRAAGSARVVVVTAPSGTRPDFDDLQGERSFSARSAFGASKAMNLLFVFGLARRLKGSGVTVDALHPGLTRSGIVAEMPAVVRGPLWLVSRPPERAGRVLADLVERPGADGEGRFFGPRGRLTPPESTTEVAAQDRLFEESEKLVAA